MTSVVAPSKGVLEAACIAMLLCVANILGIAEIFLYSQNTLLLNGHWISTKKLLEVGLMGSDSFLITRPALYRDHLNLGAWYGYNEVILRSSLRPRKFWFRFNPARGSYLNVIFDKTPNGFSGLRLSARDGYGNMFFRCTPEGGFISTFPIDLPVLGTGWHSGELDFGDGRVRAVLDGKEIGSLEDPVRAVQRVGFRVGLNPVVVDGVSIEDDGGRIVHESFRNGALAPRAVGLNVLIAMLIFGCFFLPRGRNLKDALLRFSVFNAALAAFWVPLFLFDYYYWSHQHLDPLSKEISYDIRSGFLGRPLIQRVEKARYDFFGAWNRILGGRMITHEWLVEEGYNKGPIPGPIFCARDTKEYSPRPLDIVQINDLLARGKAAYRILFVGTSQTRGAGAARLEDTFFVKTHGALVRSFGPSFPIESLNMSVEGSHITKLLDDYKEIYMKFAPDLVVINCSNNDDSVHLSEGLRGFLEINRARRIRTILLKEANSNEGYQAITARHAVLDALGAEYDVPVYNLHAFLNNPKIYKSGFLWWDNMHLTSYGQGLVAQWLFPKVAKEISSRPAVSLHFFKALH